MLKIKDALRKKDEYEIFLITLQECFDDAVNKTTDMSIRKWLRELNCQIDKVLEIKTTTEYWHDLSLEKVGNDNE
ncbi:MAG: hypothetical protein IKN65_00640 [Clostridia bacterium]|nr:hypothetical protein [Bacilli bacterium]MBR3672790.1 hypothetical protein [Clostridia bacterium]